MEFHKALADSISTLTLLWKLGKIEALERIRPLIKCMFFKKKGWILFLHFKFATLNGIFNVFF